MSIIVGIAIIFTMVFGGYLLAGGNLSVILKSLPFELMIIGGAALGSSLINNGYDVTKHTLKDIKRVFSGKNRSQEDYKDLLCLLFDLIKISKKSPIDIEEHIDAPQNSYIFKNYPKLLKDEPAVRIICDTFRAASMNYDDPTQVEFLIEKRIQKMSDDRMHSPHALQTLADALPALGIVAAVLGVIKTMSSIDQPPEILGKMIAGALVGTFLGVFLAYGFIAPLAGRLSSILKDDLHFYQILKDVLIANLHNHPANICIEVGRQNIPEDLQCSYDELEEAIRTPVVMNKS